MTSYGTESILAPGGGQFRFATGVWVTGSQVAPGAGSAVLLERLSVIERRGKMRVERGDSQRNTAKQNKKKEPITSMTFKKCIVRFMKQGNNGIGLFHANIMMCETVFFAAL